MLLYMLHAHTDRTVLISDGIAIEVISLHRRIAYSNRKYRSGWMWIGVTIGFALIKLPEEGFTMNVIRLQILLNTS